MRLIIVSNRLPFTVSMVDGTPNFQRSSGGLATGLSSCLSRAATGSPGPSDFLWFGWPGCPIPLDHQTAVSQYALTEFRAVPVFLPQQSVERFYQGFCNQTLWPLFHYFPALTRQDSDAWREYQRVNGLFAQALFDFLRPDDLVWIHDYHLMLLPALLRQRFPRLAIGFFLHIPFPCPDVFRSLNKSWGAEITDGILGASLVGFHNHEYVRNFLACAARARGYEHQLGCLTLRDRVVKVEAFPMGIDFDSFARMADAPETKLRAAALRARWPHQKIIFSADRLDYTKGLLHRLRGYELFLRRNPRWHGKVVLVLSVAPSRGGVESYRSLRIELEQTVGRIAGTYGNVQWAPLVYQYRNLGFEEMVAMYRTADVALITPLRDGMNLVAKEYIASRTDQTGVLILSELAGAAKEMGEALIINPFQEEEFADALERALIMPQREQVRRNGLLQERLRRRNVTRWADDFIQGLSSAGSSETVRSVRLLRGKPYAALAQQFLAANSRALLLDYDGTLLPFVDDPAAACPDPDLLDLLTGICSDLRNHLAIVSGRCRQELEEWFGRLPLTLIAEHGIWLRPQSEDWRSLKKLEAGWKDRVRPILQLYVDRVPGALLEEKEFSLAWHYRRADPELAFVRSNELLDDLADYTRNVELQVLEGSMVIEVRNSGINKGTAALEWLECRAPDFILAAGDDRTDEDLFRALPSTAFSVRVGLSSTAARFRLEDHTAVRRVLRGLVDLGGKSSSVCSAGTLDSDCAFSRQ
jgi:trehalose 6-phosphate synthase/phosphatase